MSFCPLCGLTYSNNNNQCSKCDVASVDNLKHWLSMGKSRIHISQLLASLIALAIILGLLLLKLPILVQAIFCCVEIGCSFAIGRFRFAIRLTRRFEALLMSAKHKFGAGGKISRWILRPAVALADLGTTLVEGISDPAVKAGFQITFWLLFGSAALVALLYIGFIIAVLVFSAVLVYFMLRILMSSGESDRGYRPRGRITVTRKGDGEHLEEQGIFGKRDLGRLHRKNYQTLETRNFLASDIRLKENKTFLGHPDPDIPYGFETEEGEKGHLKSVGGHGELEFEPDDEAKE